MTYLVGERILDLLENSVGKPNDVRTGYFVEQARIFSEKYPDTEFVEFKVPLSKQRGYALVIPPENKTEDSEYLLLSAHLDAAIGLEKIFKMYKPAANDNGFAASFLLTYVEGLGDYRGKKGLIVAGFPHEEGSEVFRTFGLLGLSIGAGVGVAKGVAAVEKIYEYVNQTVSYMLGFFGALQSYDVIGGPFKLGLIGSSRPFKKVLQEELNMDLEKIIYSLNLDMIGTSGKTTEVSIPYKSPTMNPSSWLFPKKMDKSFIADMECMLLYSAANLEIETGIENMIVNHQLFLGSSDHAELSKYLNKTSTIIHGNNWRDLHKMRDKISKLSFSNVLWYNDFLQQLTSSLEKPWKEESQLESLEDSGFISGDIEKASIYEIDDNIVCLLRKPGDRKTNQLNVLYSVEETLEGFVAKEFITYGLQDKPRDLLKYPDSNLKDWLDRRENNFERMNLEDEIMLSIGENKYSILPNEKSFLDYFAGFNSDVMNFIGERSSAAMSAGLIGTSMLLYARFGEKTGPADHIINNVVNPLVTFGHQLSYFSVLEKTWIAMGKLALEIGVILGTSKLVVEGIKRISPPAVRSMRNLSVKAGNRALDYQVIE